MIGIKEKIASPVVKWAGGKSKLAPIIDDFLEQYEIDITEIDTYVEPFIGGGGMFFYMAQKYNFKKKIIADVNIELINLYQAIKEKPSDLMKKMKELENEYNELDEMESKGEYFYDIREKFNQNIKDLTSNKLDVTQAAYFVFLNKTCFNGLYRVNSKGLYNVPFGKRAKVTLYDEENILAVSEVLQDTDILFGDYHDSLQFASASTLFYFDPPYRPLSNSSSFTSYAKSSFNDESQKELATFCREAYERNSKFILSNSDPKNSNKEDNFFDDLYKGFPIERLSVARNIGAGSFTRKKVNEIVVIGAKKNKEDEKNIVCSLDYVGGVRMRLFNYLELNEDDRLTYFMNNLSVTNRTASFYINWDKVYANTDKVEQYLHTLNFLIGKEDIEARAKVLFTEQPQLLRAVPYLLATRDEKLDILSISEAGEMSFYNLDFKKINEADMDKYIDFISESGLFEFMKKRLTNNLVDFVYGVEAGLDSNARKNRSGTMMESLVENNVAKTCEKLGIEYTDQGTPAEIKRRWGFNVPVDKSSRRYDFAIYNKSLNKLYLIETNFYGGGGSKLKSVAGEFVTLNNLINSSDENIEFIWVTDGHGWDTARIPLSEAFSKIDNIFNLKMLNDGYLSEVFQR